MKKNNKMKKIKPLVFILLLTLITIVGVTFAYLTNKEKFENKFTAKGYDVAIEEEFEGTFGKKKVSIVNKDDSDVILKVSYNELWKKEVNEKLLLLSTKVNGTEIVTKNWTDDWKHYFLDGQDGWYYYKKILKANSGVQILNSIELNESLIKTSNDYEYYKQYDYELVFNYEAVTASNEAVNELWGHTITIEDETITWNFN